MNVPRFSQPQSMVLIGQITRADGTVEEAKVLAAHYRNPVKRLRARLRGVKGKVTLHAGSRQAS